jgi:flavodoxin short chain
MKVLIIYATNSGSTEICAKVIKETLEKLKHEISMVKAAEAKADMLRGLDLVLLGSPSWEYGEKEGMPHEDMMDFFSKLNSKDLAGAKKYAVFGCGDRSYAYFCHAVEYIEDFLKTNGINVASESLKVDSFFFDMDKNIEEVENWSKSLSKLII